MSKLTRRLALTGGAALAASPAFAQKSAAQLDWEASQAAWLAENIKKPGWKATPSGLQYKRAKANTKGAQPKPDSKVAIKYEGKTTSDITFDKSPDGKAFEIGVSEMVKGMREALVMMRAGEVWDFAMPAELGYGDRQPPVRMPTAAALIFHVELVKVL